MKKDQGVRTKTNFGEGVHNAKWWRVICGVEYEDYFGTQREC